MYAKHKETGTIVKYRSLDQSEEIVKGFPHGSFTFSHGDIEVEHGTQVHHFSPADFAKHYEPASNTEAKAAGF